MGFGGRVEELLRRLEESEAAGFAAAIPGEPRPVAIDNLLRALAAFERTLVSGGSPYDRLVYRDDQGALTPQARDGMRLFFSEKTHCSECHGGLAFTGVLDYGELRRAPRPRFLDDGLSPNGLDAGLEESTGRQRDRGRFKVPTLRNIALTAPYMHDGRLPTLEAVLDHYAQPGPDREPVVLSAAERAQLLAFLDSLTDTPFVTDPRFGPPDGEEPTAKPGTRRVSAATRLRSASPEGCDDGCSRSR
jgi:cytochrome c peroxidase